MSKRYKVTFRYTNLQTQTSDDISVFNTQRRKQPRNVTSTLRERAITTQRQPFLSSTFSAIRRFPFFCGVQNGNGEHGCQCDQPCEWKQKWIHHHRPQNLKLYLNLQQQTASNQYLSQISKDIHRTYPECSTYNNNIHFQSMLKEVLEIYSIYDPQIGYAQGMNLIVAVLLYHIKNAQLTFWAFVELMDDQQLRMIYLDGFQHLKSHCSRVYELIKCQIKDLYVHMSRIDVCQVFLYGWIFSLMSNCIPLHHMPQVIDNFKTYGWVFIYNVIVCLFFVRKSELMQTDAADQFLECVSMKRMKEVQVNWKQLIKDALKLKLY